MIHFILLTQNKKSYPFDWKNPYGYSIAVILQFTVALLLLHYLACFISIAFVSYFIATTLNGFMKDDLQSINKMAKRKTSKSDIFEPFSRFVRSHAEIKELSQQ